MNPTERRIVAILGPAVVRVLAATGQRRASRWDLWPGCHSSLHAAVVVRVDALWPDETGPEIGCVVSVVHGRKVSVDHVVRDAHERVSRDGHVVIAGTASALLADPGTDVLWGRFVPHTVLVRGDVAALWFTRGSRPKGYPAIVVL